MFQAQKLMAETQVARARFIPRRVPALGTGAVLTFSPNQSSAAAVSVWRKLSGRQAYTSASSLPRASTFVLGAHLLTLKIPAQNTRAVGPYPNGPFGPGTRLPAST